MAQNEVEAVLANWIAQAFSPNGRLPEGISPASWVAAQFSEWWQYHVNDTIDGIERATLATETELKRLGGWASFGEALHELTHARESIEDLRKLIGPSNGVDA